MLKERKRWEEGVDMEGCEDFFSILSYFSITADIFIVVILFLIIIYGYFYFVSVTLFLVATPEVST